MRNIIPFKKDVIFKTSISEITSISLENTLSLENDTISGEFIVSGEYKVSDSSTSVEPFTLNLPFSIVIDDRYDTSKAKIDIDDFYYEIANNNVLSVSIDVLVDKLEEKPLITLDDLTDETEEKSILNIEEETMNNIEERKDVLDLKDEVRNEDNEINDVKEEVRNDTDVKNDTKEEVRNENEEINDVEEKINSLFNQFSTENEVYVTYNVFIVRDGDNLDSIMDKYGVNEELLKQYNDLSNLQIGDKLIIPASYERD